MNTRNSDQSQALSVSQMNELSFYEPEGIQVVQKSTEDWDLSLSVYTNQNEKFYVRTVIQIDTKI